MMETRTYVDLDDVKKYIDNPIVFIGASEDGSDEYGILTNAFKNMEETDRLFIDISLLRKNTLNDGSSMERLSKFLSISITKPYIENDMIQSSYCSMKIFTKRKDVCLQCINNCKKDKICPFFESIWVSKKLHPHHTFKSLSDIERGG